VTERLIGLALRAPAGGALDDGRRHILPAGAVVLEAVARAAGAAGVIVSDHGIRHARARILLAGERR
jgi:exopolyphosphatase/pppGpp-phosphohydrolase